MHKFFMIIFPSCFLLAGCPKQMISPQPDPHDLRFDNRGTFKIVQFADIHWVDGDPNDRNTVQLMSTILDSENPDLVVLTGDVLAGESCKNAPRALRDCAQPMIERQINWAMVLGNHDDEGSSGRHELMNTLQSLPFCLSRPGPQEITGVGNFYLPVFSADNHKNKAILYFLDSNSYAPEGLGTYDWIRPNQVSWYLTTARELCQQNKGTPLPALLFFHIPIPEYNLAYDSGAYVGHKYEDVCCPQINSGLFAAILEAKDVMATFVGHDHVNDFAADWHGVKLCYGRVSGFNAYSRDGFARGARVIVLYEGRKTFKTWLHLEYGDIVYQ